MQIESLTILGKSDAAITMILDNLESNNQFPKINVINNLKLPIYQEYENNKFEIEFFENLTNFTNLILGVFKPNSKSTIFASYTLSPNNFLSIIHSSSQISNTSVIGNGSLINSLVSIAAHTKLGKFVSVNRNSSIGHHTNIYDFVTINPGVNIAGNVVIGEKTLIGMGANIIDGIKIGSNTVIGAGSVVTKDIPDNVVAYGNPCKIIRYNE